MKYEGKIYGKVANKYIELRPEATAKALMHNGVFVDPNRLHEGIYSKPLPTLYDPDTTIEFLVDRAKSMTDPTGTCWFEAEYFENLRSCQLTGISISISA
jgi:hypothetical protein